MPIDTDLKELRVAVTGGTSGLGLALVRLLAARGAYVAFVARTEAAVKRTADATGTCGIVGDVGRKDDIYPIALQVMGNLGGLDVLINNASSLGPTPLALLADTECEELEQALAVNLLGPFRLTKALFGALAASAREGCGAVVINISSDAAINAYPGWGAYGASKAALRHLTAIWGGGGTACFSRSIPGAMYAAACSRSPDADPSALKARGFPPRDRPIDCAALIAGRRASRGRHLIAATPGRGPPGFCHDAMRMRHLPSSKLANSSARLPVCANAAALAASLAADPSGSRRGPLAAGSSRSTATSRACVAAISHAH